MKNLSFRPKIRNSLIVLSLLFTGCSHSRHHEYGIVKRYREGQWQQLEKKLSKKIDKELPAGNYENCQDASWLLLDRAMTYWLLEKHDLAVSDFNLALRAIDYYKQSSTREEFSKFLLSDTQGAYVVEDYEQILASVYFALTLLSKGDQNNAYALLRQAEQTQQLLQENYRLKKYTAHYRLSENALAKYLFAALLENRQDISNAELLYKQCQKIHPSSQITNDLQRLGSYSSQGEATLIILAHNGIAPIKISDTLPASIASTAALESYLGAKKIDPSLSTLTGIPVPEFQQVEDAAPRELFVDVDQKTLKLEPWYNTSQTARQQLNQKIPGLVAKGVARLVSRRGLLELSSRKSKSDNSMLADMLMLAANLATDADTRSWHMLPGRIDLLRINLKPGRYPIKLHTQNQQSVETEITLNKGDFVVLNSVYTGKTLNLIRPPSKEREPL